MSLFLDTDIYQLKLFKDILKVLCVEEIDGNEMCMYINFNLFSSHPIPYESIHFISFRPYGQLTTLWSTTNNYRQQYIFNSISIVVTFATLTVFSHLKGMHPTHISYSNSYHISVATVKIYIINIVVWITMTGSFLFNKRTKRNVPLFN